MFMQCESIWRRMGEILSNRWTLTFSAVVYNFFGSSKTLIFALLVLYLINENLSIDLDNYCVKILKIVTQD